MFLRFLLSLILSVVSFKVFYTFFPMIFLSLLISVLGFYAAWKILGLFLGKKEEKSDKIPQVEKRHNEIHKEGIAKLKNIRSKTRLISDNAVAEKIQNICKIGFEIFDYIEKNPDDLKRARQFINYYLDTTEKIVVQYVELSSKQNPGSEVSETLVKVENVLDSIHKTYEKQLQNLLEDDLLDLNTEIQVLEKTIQLEG